VWGAVVKKKCRLTLQVSSRDLQGGGEGGQTRSKKGKRTQRREGKESVNAGDLKGRIALSSQRKKGENIRKES